MTQLLPLLTADEERALGLRIRAGAAAADELAGRDPGTDRERALKATALDGDAAVRELVERNLRLVIDFVRRCACPTGMAREDMDQAGAVGLMRAARDFDPDRFPGQKFSTYAIWWIRHDVLSECQDKGHLIRLPRYIRDAAARMRKNRDVPDSKRRVVERYFRLRIFGSSSDIDSIPCGQEPACAGMDRGELADCVRHSVAGLSPRERRVIEGRHFEHKSLSAMGDELGITKERVRQIQVQATAKLRDLIGAEMAI